MAKTRTGLIRGFELDLIADLAAVAAAGVFHDGDVNGGFWKEKKQCPVGFRFLSVLYCAGKKRNFLPLSKVGRW